MAVNVAKLPVTILDDDETIDLTGRFSLALTQFDPGHVWFSLVVADLDEQSGLMAQVRARDRASQLTAAIQAKDDERDDLLGRIKRKCVFLAGEPVVEPKAAAERVLAAMALRNLPKSKMGDTEQTVRVNELLGDFAGAALTADITLLGLTALVAELNQRQQEFEQLIGQRAAEQSPPDEEKLPSTREVREHMQESLSVVRNDLALAARRNEATYGSVAALVSGHIDEIVAKARARRTREAGDEQENPPAEA